MPRGRRRRTNPFRAHSGGGFFGDRPGGGFSNADMDEMDEQMMRHLCELLRRTRAEEFYRERRRARYRGGLGDFFFNIIAAVLSIIGGIFSEIFPEKGQYEKREKRDTRGRNKRGGGGGPDDEHASTDSASSSSSHDPFQTLGLSKESATTDDVVRAYKKLAIRWHPDKNDQSEESVAMMQTINEAREQCLAVLSKGGEGGGAGGGAGGGGDGDGSGGGGGGAKADDSSSDEDVGGADGAEKARRRAERTYRKEEEEAQRAYTRKRKQERNRMRREAKHPGGRFRRQQAAHQQQHQHQHQQGSSSVRGHHTQMERNQHEIAVAARAGASIVLQELLQHDFPPLLEVDNDGNTPLHYAARFEPGLVDEILRVVGSEWERAVLLKNRFGETPADLLTPVVEELDPSVAAVADKVDALKGSSPAAQEERRRLAKESSERAEQSQRGAARLRQLTDMACAAAEKQTEMEKRTFDPKGLVRLIVIFTAAFSAGYLVIWTEMWGRWVFSLIVGVFVANVGMSIITTAK